MFLSTLNKVKRFHHIKLVFKATQRKLCSLRGIAESLNSSICVSTCQNIFYNLAFEDWIYENVDFEQRSMLFLWRNEPCVVIGRHQNPWLEVNIQEINQRGINLARRKSGGGTVYHDLGNLNCTFFTSRKKYDRGKNLELVVQAIKKKWGLDVHVNKRDDIMLNQAYKISGTAAKLGRNTAYHHFTVLIDVDKSCLNDVLHSKQAGQLVTKATESVRAEVKNLRDIDSRVTYNELVQVIAEEYATEVLREKKSDVMYVNPSVHPEVETHHQQLQEWSWKFGWTPKFKVQQRFKIQHINTSNNSNQIIQNEDKYHGHSKQNPVYSKLNSSLDLDSNTDKNVENCKINICDNLNHEHNVILNDSDVSKHDMYDDIMIEIDLAKGCFNNINITSENISNISSYSNYFNQVLKGRKFSPADLDIYLSNLDTFADLALDSRMVGCIMKCLLSLMPEVK